MTTRDIIISVLRKHLITRKIAGKIADEIIKEQRWSITGVYANFPQFPKE
jgi:hypothetical protein